MDDDDEGFGGFAFAAPVSMPSTTNFNFNGGNVLDLDFDFPSNVSVINGSNIAEDDDDDWGDFVRSPIQLMKTEASADPFDAASSLRTGRSGPPGSNWVKLSGALPLSLFGEVEEEDEEQKSSGAGPELFGGSASKEWTKTDVKEVNGRSLVLNLAPGGDFDWGFVSKTDHKVEAGNAVVSDGFGSNHSGVSMNVVANGLSNGIDEDVKGSVVGDDEGFGDDDEWEFQDARLVEAQPGHVTTKVDRKEPENFAKNALNSTDFLVVSNGILQKSGGWDFGANFWEFKDAFTATGSKNIEFVVNENGSKFNPANGHVENGENIQGTLSETELKDKSKEVRFKNQTGALPLSLFGHEELQSETSDDLNPQGIFTHSTSTSTVKDANKSLTPALLLNDLISSLYSQAEQNTTLNHTRSKSGDDIDSLQEVLDSNLELGDGNGDFEDDSWEFKDAFSGSIAVNHTSVPNHGDLGGASSTRVGSEDYADFYSKLKQDLYFVLQFYFVDLKKARDTAAVSGNEAEVKALDEEIQDLCNELHQENITFGEALSEKHIPKNILLKEISEALQEPKFLLLESEYHLSQKLLSAEKEWKSAVELLKHAAFMLKILKLRSREDQSNYVSTWFKILSVCAQELRHGAVIWKQALVQKVHDQLSSHPQGKQYILALAEIYRLVEVIRCSVKLYKPWVLFSSVDTSPSDMFSLLSECVTLWQSSGLEEALQSISDTASSMSDGSPNDIIESVKYIHDLDVLALDNHVSSMEEPTCQISALAAGTIPGMKIVEWNGQHYFVKLANLWSNLISSNPPNLPQIQVG